VRVSTKRSRALLLSTSMCRRNSALEHDITRNCAKASLQFIPILGILLAPARWFF
jgi:hypothetical protein